jgi:hypothetical protein
VKNEKLIFFFCFILRFIKGKVCNKLTVKELIDEFDVVYLGNPLEQYYLLPYTFSKFTFFLLIQGLI